MAVNKKIIEVEIDGKKVDLAVIRPNQKQRQEAQKVYNKAFREALDSGAILRAKIESVMREQKLWDDNKERQLKVLQNKVADGEKRIKSGGIKLSDARELALSLKKVRTEIRGLNSERINLDNNSAEAQADNAQFNFYVSSCTVSSENGKPHFKSYEDYINREDDPIIGKAAGAMASIIYNLEDDYEKKLPENQFLIKYKFANDKLEFIDKKGRKIDSEGRLLDKESRYIDEEGNYIDIDGNPIDKEGNYVVDEKPFLDEDGVPLVEEIVSLTPVEGIVSLTPVEEVVKESTEPQSKEVELV